MIFDLAFNSDHNLYLVDRDIAFIIDENDAIVQRLKIRLQFLYGEWFLNNQIGLPYTQFIFEAGGDLRDIYELFEIEIRNTEGVEIVNEIDFDYDGGDRILTLNFQINNSINTNTLEISL